MSENKITNFRDFDVNYLNNALREHSMTAIAVGSICDDKAHVNRACK